jgi:hypothetical protein
VAEIMSFTRLRISLPRFAQHDSDIFGLATSVRQRLFEQSYRARGQSLPAPAPSSLPKAGMFEPLAILITHGLNRRHTLQSDV